MGLVDFLAEALGDGVARYTEGEDTMLCRGSDSIFVQGDTTAWIGPFGVNLPDDVAAPALADIAAHLVELCRLLAADPSPALPPLDGPADPPPWLIEALATAGFVQRPEGWERDLTVRVTLAGEGLRLARIEFGWVTSHEQGMVEDFPTVTVGLGVFPSDPVVAARCLVLLAGIAAATGWRGVE